MAEEPTDEDTLKNQIKIKELEKQCADLEKQIADLKRQKAESEKDLKNAEKNSEIEAEKAKADLEKQISDFNKQKAENERALKNAEKNSEIEAEKAKTDLEKQIAEAERDTLKAKYPDTEIKAPEGKLTIDENVTIECQIITYNAMFQIAEQISKEIKIKGKPDRVVICEKNDINALYSYKAFLEQFLILKKQYEDKCKEKEAPKGMTMQDIIQRRPIQDVIQGMPIQSFVPMPALIAGTAVLKSVIGLASFFRSDEEIKGVKVEIDNESLIAEVAKGLESNGISTVYPAFKTTVPSEFFEELSELKEIADKRIEESTGNENIVTCLKDLNNQYNTLLTTLTTVDEKTGISNLEKVLKGKMLESILNNEDNGNDGNTYMLHLKVVFAEGNKDIKTKMNLWHKLSHTGGAIITYFLMDKEGNIKVSNNFYNLLGPIKFNNIKSDEKSHKILKNNFKK